LVLRVAIGLSLCLPTVIYLIGCLLPAPGARVVPPGFTEPQYPTGQLCRNSGRNSYFLWLFRHSRAFLISLILDLSCGSLRYHCLAWPSPQLWQLGLLKVGQFPYMKLLLMRKDHEIFRLKDELEKHEGPGVTFYGELKQDVRKAMPN
jgi:hypothetical protein